MEQPTSIFPVSNSRSVPHLISVEPWGADYTLLPGESMEVIAYGDIRAPWFELVEGSRHSQVFCESAVTFEVMQNGVVLECGHNRETDHR